jgi:hypothetical protein
LLLNSLEGLLDENQELPGNFLHELYKWALESEFDLYFSTLKFDLNKNICGFSSFKAFVAFPLTLVWDVFQTTQTPNQRK